MNSVDRIVFCRQNYILSNRIRILLDRITFCRQNVILSDRIVFCPTELYSVNRIRDVTNGAPYNVPTCGTQVQRRAAPALRISQKKGSFFKTSACPRFCKRRVLFCTQVRSMGVNIPLQSTITGYGHTDSRPGNSTCVVSRTMAHCDTAVLPV